MELVAAEQTGTETRRKTSPITPRTKCFLTQQIVSPAFQLMRMRERVGILVRHH